MSSQPLLISSDSVARLVDSVELSVRLERELLEPAAVPRRAVAELAGEDGALLLAMPALARDLAIAKLVSVRRRASKDELASHLLALDSSGQLLAIIDGEELTARRTAAASLLASRLLVRGDPKVLGVLGAGRQSRALALAYCKAYSLERVQVWARQIRAAQALADELAPLCRVAVSCSTVDKAVEGASIVTSATPSTAPLVRSGAVGDQSHVDLVGSFRPDMREADDELVSRAFVVADCEAALVESGDLAQPLGAGVIKRGDVHLFAGLLGGGVFVPLSERPTLFKSVGHAGLDLIAVRHLLEKLGLGAAVPSEPAHRLGRDQA